MLGFQFQVGNISVDTNPYTLVSTKAEIERLRYKKVTIDDDVVAVIFTSKKEIKAYSLRCTHKGCGLKIKGEQEIYFACSCHGSKFSENGDALKGPAKLPLHQRIIKVEQDKIYINRI